MPTIEQLPGPAGLPLVGNALQLKPARAYQQLCEWADRYGPVYRLKIGRRSILVISDAAVISEVLRNRPATYRRWNKMEELGLEVGADGVFVAEGDKWRRHRALIVPTFGQQPLRRFWTRLDAVTERLEQQWHRRAVGRQPFDIRQDAMRYTVDIVAGFAFGSDLDTLNDQDSPLQGYLSQFLQTAARRQAAIFPYWRYVKSAADRNFDVALSRINQTVSDMIAQTRARMAADPQRGERPGNMIEALVAHQASHPTETLGDGEIVGNVLTFLLAGEDTTANTIAWTIYYMARHPEIQGEMQREADRVIGAGSRVSEMEQLDELRYTHAVIQESMRLKPVFPLLTLEPNQDVLIGDLPVSRGTPLFLLSGLPGQQAAHFTDAQQMCPTRWLNDPRYRDDNGKAFMPFGSGPRYCPGHRLATLECVMAISTLARNFNVRADATAQQTREVYAFTLCPSQVSVTLQKR